MSVTEYIDTLPQAKAARAAREAAEQAGIPEGYLFLANQRKQLYPDLHLNAAQYKLLVDYDTAQAEFQTLLNPQSLEHRAAMEVHGKMVRDALAAGHFVPKYIAEQGQVNLYAEFEEFFIYSTRINGLEYYGYAPAQVKQPQTDEIAV
jgi:hypothetical protein